VAKGSKMISKQAGQVVLGDKLCEADGFMWEVKAIKPTSKCFVTFTLSPVFTTSLRERQHDKRIKLNSMLRVHQDAVDN
jgi:hypothetical protein